MYTSHQGSIPHSGLGVGVGAGQHRFGLDGLANLQDGINILCELVSNYHRPLLDALETRSMFNIHCQLSKGMAWGKVIKSRSLNHHSACLATDPLLNIQPKGVELGEQVVFEQLRMSCWYGPALHFSVSCQSLSVQSGKFLPFDLHIAGSQLFDLSLIKHLARQTRKPSRP